MAFALTERWDEVRVLFEGALEQPKPDRAGWLVAHCPHDDMRAEVAALVACHERPNALLDGGGVGLAAALETTLPEDYQIGSYRIERLLGRGGMGAVYLARRSDASFDRQVAVKIIGRSLDSADALRRFLVERQTLAGLDHPNIARLLDGGTTPDRLPYFVMEYVAGEPIDQYCTHHSLDLDARLTLFLRVAAAVQHAHEHLIVHRDLKPDNVLVREDGEPKLLDFGIAKTIAPDESFLTTIDARAMTPRYASPEQIRGETIGTSSDVYSLGVLLYQLLTGQLPHGGAAESGWRVAREITDCEPPAPSAAARKSPIEEQWAHRLPGDLDAILLMALRKEPERRYRSADQFADDIRHFQSGRPVVARPDTLGYRARKFVSRNRLATAAAALAVLALIGGVVAASWQARAARAAAIRAQAEATRAGRVSEFLKTVIALPDPTWNSAGAGGRNDMTVLDLLKNAGDRIDTEFGADPLMAAELHHAIGNTYRARGMPNEALPHFSKALELRQRLLPPDDPRIADSLYYYGANQFWLGHFDVAEQYYDQAIAILRTVPFAQAQQLPYVLLDLPTMPSYVNDFARTKAVLVEAHDLAARHFGPTHMLVAFSLERLGGLYQREGDNAAAKEVLTEALRIMDLNRAGPLERSAAQLILASVLASEGDLAGAAALYRQTIEVRRTAYGDAHVATLDVKNQLASTLYSMKQYTEAVRIADEVIAEAAGEDDVHARQLLAAHITRVLSLEAMHAAGAASSISQAIRILDHSPTIGRCLAAESRKHLADHFVVAHRHADAVRMFARAFADADAGCGHDSPTYKGLVQAAPAFQFPLGPH